MADLPPKQWQQLQDLFHQALDLPEPERSHFIDQQTASVPHLAPLLRDMLGHHGTLDDLFDHPETLLGDLAMDGQAAALPPLDLPLVEAAHEAHPERIGPYRLEGLIGRGGMGSVYRAERVDGTYEQQVAIKMIRRGLDTDDLLQRFRTEQQILARLVHPNIARMLDAGTLPDGRAFLIMEYIEGQPITTYCDAQQLSLEARLELFLTVCQAVHFAHQNLVVHRDLKPSNILITQAGEVKLLDFGIAKLLAPDALPFTVAHTTHMLRLMTPEYAAPEQIRGEPITTSTDVYSLGILLVELLTGQRPYALPNRIQREVERIICEEPPIPPSTLVSHTPSHTTTTATSTRSPDQLRRRLKAGLDDVALFALRKEPQRRYASMQDFANDITHYLSGLPVQARPDAWTYRARLYVKRHTTLVVATVLVFATLVLGLASTLWQARIAAGERDTAEQEAARARAVQDFLVQSFRASSPSIERMDTTSVLTWLNQSATQIDAGFADQPLVHLEMLLTVGDVYRSLGQYDDATRLLDHAHRLAQQHTTLNSRPHAQADLLRGVLAHDVGNYAYADSLLASALVQFEALADFRQAARARSEYGRAHYYHTSDPGAALALYEENLTYYQSLSPPPLSQLASVLNGIHRYNLALGNRDAARTALTQAVSLFRELNDGGQRLALGLYNLGLLKTYYLPYDWPAAEEHFRESQDLFERIYPEGHYRTSISLFPLGELLWQRGAWDEGERLIREGLQIRREQLPAGHFLIAEGLVNLGNMLRAQARAAEAVPVFRESFETYREARGPTYRRTVEAQRGLIAVLDTLARSAEAERYRALLPPP